MVVVHRRLAPSPSPRVLLVLGRHVTRRDVDLDRDHLVGKARQLIRRARQAAVHKCVETATALRRDRRRHRPPDRRTQLDAKARHVTKYVAELSRVLVEDVVVGEEYALGGAPPAIEPGKRPFGTLAVRQNDDAVENRRSRFHLDVKIGSSGVADVGRRAGRKKADAPGPHVVLATVEIPNLEMPR